ncbi:hypothetical protein BaRGS_00032642, partial [Batillaria attramentaria]
IVSQRTQWSEHTQVLLESFNVESSDVRVSGSTCTSHWVTVSPMDGAEILKRHLVLAGHLLLTLVTGKALDETASFLT